MAVISVGLYMDSRLITCDIVCLGVASPGLFSVYLDWLSESYGSKVNSYCHRGRGDKWGTYEEHCKLADGRIMKGDSCSTVWKRIWSSLCLRPSCYVCSYHSLDRPGNITIGDFWGVESVFPDIPDKTGVSCLLVNNALGLEVIRGVGSELELVACSVDDVANSKQPMLQHPRSIPADRDDFWSELYENGFEAACRQVGAYGAARKIKDLFNGLVRKDKRRVEKEHVEWCNTTVPPISCEHYPIAFAARNSCKKTRTSSTSGGVFSALAQWAINQGGVVYGCSFDEGLHAVHIRCETMQECKACMGTKYSQSDLGKTIQLVREDLAAKRLVVFTGTPCQVDAVQKLCGNTENYNSNERKMRGQSVSTR